jgi:hypothetical protein
MIESIVAKTGLRRRNVTIPGYKTCYTLDVHCRARVNDREGIYRAIATCIEECISYISIHSCERQTCRRATVRGHPHVWSSPAQNRSQRKAQQPLNLVEHGEPPHLVEDEN